MTHIHILIYSYTKITYHAKFLGHRVVYFHFLFSQAQAR